MTTKRKPKQQIVISPTVSPNSMELTHTIDKELFIADNLDLFFRAKQMINEKMKQYDIVLTDEETKEVLRMIMSSYGLMNTMSVYASMIGHIMNMVSVRK